MSQRRILRRKSIGALFAAIGGARRRIVAPVRTAERVNFEAVTRPEQVCWDYVQTADSAKAAVFPRHDPLLRYTLAGKDVDAQAIAPDATPTVLLGVHPCDAASFARLKAVFTWGSGDAYFEPRLEALTVVGLSCTKGDEYCFCTSVGCGPGATDGSDILLTPIDADGFSAEVLTDKGEALVALAGAAFEPDTGGNGRPPLADIKPRFSAQEAAKRLPAQFDNTELWAEQSLRCLGCGACAFVCPVCSCFDVQDERDYRRGGRLRCWDSCGFSLFTLHGSGHNPRSRQSERWRQRMMHKFSYQPERLGVTGCVGCGRCSRACPVDMNLAEHMTELAGENAEAAIEN